MSVVVVVVVVISASAAGCGLSKSFFKSYFFQKEFFGELIVFRNLNMNFAIFFYIILSGLSKLSSQFQDKNITVK